ncbi:hypothetical protein GGS21DRAFT_526825 [Xylaria nigripes]|nr:hypothetical protein GGS21DRAFT_526825 [Xylaria nigripes]
MVKSLRELCTAVCLRHTIDITDIGDLSYDLVRPIILKVDSAVQLHQLETNSPHLQDHTAECWRRFISRDFPLLSERNNYLPSNPRSWHKIYLKYKRMDADQKREAQEKLMNAFNEIKKEKDSNVSQVINYDRRKLPRLPRDVKPQVGTRPRGRQDSLDLSELRFTGGSRTKVNTPKSLLNRAKREAKEISTRNRLNAQAGITNIRPAQIQRAPAGMVHEKVTDARPLTGIRPPMQRPQASARNREMKDREARLQKAKGSFIDDEDLDDLNMAEDSDGGGLDVDELEALFDPTESNHAAGSPGASTGLTSSKISSFARRMNKVSGSPSRSRVHVEPQSRQKSSQPQKVPTADKPLITSSSAATSGPADPVPKQAPSSSPGSSNPALMLPRKRKAVDIFMKPKPKVLRP